VPADEDFLLKEDEATRAPTEPRGFAPGQMVRCEECLRANPPVRTNCLYCAAALPMTEQSAALLKPTLRPLEKWERGFNSIFIPGRVENLNADNLEAVASLLRMTNEEARRIAEAKEPLPIARVATEAEAVLIERRLEELGLRVLTIADEVLALESSPPRRIRSLELTDDALVACPPGSSERLLASWDNITLLVKGRVVVRQVEVEERRGRREENEIVETRELSADDALLDIYASTQNGNWRIVAGNFDFSCLGEKKSLVSAQNFAVLLAQLRARANHAEYDESYARVRHALNTIWPLEQQTESRGWRRGGPGRYSTEMVTTSDNERQFTRYSRLRYYLRTQRTDADS
jgi:hypothetical protein